MYYQGKSSGMCGADPGGKISIKNNDMFLVKDLQIQNCAGINTESISIHNDWIKVCAMQGGKEYGGMSFCVESAIKSDELPFNEWTLKKAAGRFNK